MVDRDFTALNSLVAESHSNICGMVALKDGEMVYSHYWHGFRPTDAVNVMSVAKSVTSLLVGIAVDQGLISGVDQRALDFFPDYTVKRGEKTIQQVTLKHLLTMTAPFKYSSEPWTRVCSSDDWTKAALDLLGGRAGITGEFKYSTLGIHILMGVIARTSGMRTIDFANRFLFQPLGIASHQNYQAETAKEHKEFTLSKQPRENLWFCDPQEVNTAGWGLTLTAADMAKLGQLCLEGGTCRGERIVSSAWIDQSTQAHFHCGESFGRMSYGYLWWIPDRNQPAYVASGVGGNVIYINPASRVVVAVTSLFNPRVFDRIQFIQEYVEPLL